MIFLNAFLVCFLGNILPIPFILWLITPIFNKMKKTKLFSGLVDKLERKAMSKKEQIERLQYLGLMLFVGIPLPGTGAWTGCLIAALLDMNKKKALLFSILGVIMAGNDGRRGYIYHTAVDPQYRNQGIATLLVKNVLSALERQGINKVAMVVFEKNTNGNAFWERLGFTKRDDLIYRNKTITEMVHIDT